jgi:hypothetical protein
VCAAKAVRGAPVFSPNLLAVGGVDLLGFVPQDRDLLLRETVGQKQIALLSELPELLRGELHRDFLPMRGVTG